MNTEDIKNKKKLYLKLAELYRDLDLLQQRKQCNEDVVFHDTYDITITDNTICQNIYTVMIDNLIEQINEYERKFDGECEYISEVCELICKPDEHIYVVFNDGREEDFDENIFYAHRTKNGWRLREHSNSIIVTKCYRDDVRMIGIKRNVSHIKKESKREDCFYV